MRRPASIAAALTVVLAWGAAVAEDPQGYLPPGAVDAVQVVGPPPAPGSAAEAADIAVYRDAARDAGSPRWKQAAADDDISTPAVLKRYACALDADLDPVRAPALTRLLHRVETDATTIGAGAKKTYNRPRPFAADDPATPLCIDIPADRRGKTSSTYPSGHATGGTLMGLVLAQAAPEHATAVMARTHAFADSRRVCRMHYPSDVAAGERLAGAIFARLQASPEFQADVKAAAAEIAAAPDAKGCAG